MLEAGVTGYHVKGSSTSGILDSIERVAEGETSLSLEVTGEVIGELVDQLAVHRRHDERRESHRARIERAIAHEGALEAFLQPIYALGSGLAVGFEALARFRGPPRRGPNLWFAEAAEVGLRRELEFAAAERALALLPELPEGAYLSVNLSPSLLPARGFRRLLAKVDADRIVIEITEHAPVADYERLRAGLGPIRKLGVRLAIDDAGAGFASLKHILQLAPDFIKLDRSLIAGIERDSSEQALAAGLISFSGKIGAAIVAEGIERAGELQTLRDLGVRFGQGYLLGRPARARVALAAAAG
jgi:EAL domain-containing protein (putative c-di-GMP-specific phosphodiesterase class I)